MGTRVAYMSKPFYIKGEAEKISETRESIKNSLAGNMYNSDNVVHEIEANGFMIFIIIDKHLSMNPEFTWHLDTQHTNWVYMMDDSIDNKGEGGFYK